MGSGSELKARRKNQKSVLPLSLPKAFELNAKTSKFSTWAPIIALLFILHFTITGKLIPYPIITIASALSAPFKLFTKHGVVQSISEITEHKYLGSSPAHGLTSYKARIPEKNKFIFPVIQDSNILKELGYERLFGVKSDSDNKNKNFYFYSPDYYEDFSKELKKGPNDDMKDMKGIKSHEQAIKNFKKNGQRVYGGNENPEVVLVTALNYENLDPSYLVKIVQNRVDYAHKNKYGVYARWAQEFIPIFQKTRNDVDLWSRISILREAMVAFPNAKWFWYIDETSLIMRDDISISNYILKKEALEPIMLKDQPVVPPEGVIKTYSNVKVEDISLLLTPTKTGVNTNNFLVKNDLKGHAILDMWNNPLIRVYSAFRRDTSKAIEHLLQWHPTLLASTGIIPPRTLNAVAPPEDSKNNDDEFIYHNGDLLISFPKCKDLAKCERLLGPFYDQTQQKGAL